MVVYACSTVIIIKHVKVKRSAATIIIRRANSTCRSEKRVGISISAIRHRKERDNSLVLMNTTIGVMGTKSKNPSISCKVTLTKNAYAQSSRIWNIHTLISINLICVFTNQNKDDNTLDAFSFLNDGCYSFGIRHWRNRLIHFLKSFLYTLFQI